MSGQDIPEMLRDRVVHDVTTDCLISDSVYDTHVSDILCAVFTHFHNMFERLVSAHLPGGQHYDMSSKQRTETASVVKHNKICEEMFGHLDRLVRIRPKATILTNESHLVYMKNRTGEWLASKSDEEKSKILRESGTNAQKMLKQFRQNQKVVQQGRIEYLREKEKKGSW